LNAQLKSKINVLKLLRDAPNNFFIFSATFTIKKNPFYIDGDEDDDDSDNFLKVKSKDADSIGEVDITEEEQGIYRVTYVPHTPGKLCW
jgi:hypothetical protein